MVSRREHARHRRNTVFIVIIPLVFGIALFAVSVITSMENRRMIIEELKDHGHLQNSLLAENIQGKLDSMSTVLVILQEQHTHPHFSENSEEFYTLLRRYALIDPKISSVFVLDHLGIQLFSSQRRYAVDPSLGLRVSVPHTKQGLSYQLLFDKETNRLMMSAVLREEGYDELRVLVFEIDAEKLFSAVDDIETSEMISGMITNYQGEVLSTWVKPRTIVDPDLLNEAQEYMETALAVLQQEGSPTTISGGTRTVENRRFLMVSSKLSNYPIQISMTYAKDQYASFWFRLFYRSLLMLGLFFLLSVVGSILLRRRIIRADELRLAVMNNLESLVKDRTSELIEKSRSLEQSNSAYESAMEDLKASEQYLHEIIDASPAAIVTIDSYGHVLSWNRAAQQMFGWTEEQVLGELIPFVDKAQLEEFAHFRRRAFTGERLSEVEITRKRRNGTSIVLSLSTAPIINSEGEIIAVLSLLADITERKSMEHEVEHQRQVFQSLFESSPDAIAVLDHEDRIVEINKSFTRLFQYAPEEAAGRAINQLIVPPQRASEAQTLTEKVRSSSIVREETIRSRKDGSCVEVSLIGYPIIIHGRQLGMFGIYRDMSQQRKIELQLVQSRKMESVGRLAGGVAHDFNNMLGVILGYSEMVLEQINEKSPFRAELNEILAAARRSADLTKQLLAFARQQTIYPKNLNLNDVIENMHRMLKRLIGENIELVWIPGKDIGLVSIDPSQVDQILVNLCINARESIDDIGKITIETGNVSVDERYSSDHVECDPGEYVMLAVSDDGCGMDSETLSLVFEPFFTTKRQGEGTGLGLATVFGIVKQNHGFINAYSELGIGSTFKIYLPLQKQSAVTETVKTVNTQEMKGNETILLVDDDSMVRNMTAAMLQQLGYQVISASSPSEALELASLYENISLLLTDVIMPDMNGKDLYYRIKEKLPDLLCLYMSGYTSNVVVHRGVVDEGIGFLQKPFNRNSLALKIREVLNSR